MKEMNEEKCRVTTMFHRKRQGMTSLWFSMIIYTFRLQLQFLVCDIVKRRVIH